jgi:hypothetical protein
MRRPYALLEKMRRAKMGCSPDDLRRLYEGFGFERSEGGNHTIYTHHRYRDLRATVARHNTLPIGYYSSAVRLVDEVIAREKKEQEEQDSDAT